MLQVDNLCFQFAALAPWCFSFSANAGSTLAIIGESGTGKSTLLNLIAGFYSPTSGTIAFHQQCLNALSPAKRPVSMLFQDNNLFEHLRVEQNIALGIHPGLQLSSQEWQQVSVILEQMELADKARVYPQQLSGGQRQRVALARCLLQNKPILLLDEPFTALDNRTKQSLFSIIKHFQKIRSLTILLVSHQKEDILTLADTFIELTENQISRGGLIENL